MTDMEKDISLTTYWVLSDKPYWNPKVPAVTLSLGNVWASRCSSRCTWEVPVRKDPPPQNETQLVSRSRAKASLELSLDSRRIWKQNQTGT